MFKKELQSRLQKIFGFQKSTFDSPGDAYEQSTLFIEVNKSTSNAGQGMVSARVEGTLTVYAKHEEFPYGYFNKRITKAPYALTKDLFFFDIDTDVAASPARTINLAERRTRFLFLYSDQFDPEQGELNEVVFEGDE